MKVRLASLQDVAEHGFDTVIDVRSPAEFAEDHVPGAINLPVLDDAERAQVGTIYKQQSPFRARVLGAALVARNAARHIERELADQGGAWRPLVYCWRGGQRSNSFASILEQIGWRVGVVEGGYRSYRRLVMAAMHEAPVAHRIVVVDGNTGTAKTALLQGLAERGHQVIDLEGLARHRGSLFGGRPGGQPSQKAFEAAVAMALARFDTARPVIVEAESSRVGVLQVPPSLWDAMREAPRIEIAAPRAARAAYLTGAYADIVADSQTLTRVLDDLVSFQGHERVDRWRALAAAGDYVTLAAELMEHHYDPRYARSRARHSGHVVATIRAEDLAPAALADLADRLSAAISEL